MQIFVARRGQRAGPYTEEQVRGMLAKKIAQPADLAWHEGLAEWQSIHTILGLEGPPPLPEEAPAPAASYHTPEHRTWGPKGVGGWLLFFCVGLTILAPLGVLLILAVMWSMAETAFAAYPSLKTAILWEESVSFAVMVYGFVVGLLIWRGSPRGRELAKTFILVNLAAVIAAQVVGLILMQGVPEAIFERSTREAVSSIFRTFLSSLIWWLYFKKSVRVRNTYGTERG